MMNKNILSEKEIKLFDDIYTVIAANKKVNDAEVIAVLNNLFHHFSPAE